MSNECQRVIMLHEVTEIRRRLQEENVSISHESLSYAERGMVAVHFLSEQYLGTYG